MYNKIKIIIKIGKAFVLNIYIYKIIIYNERAVTIIWGSQAVS